MIVNADLPKYKYLKEGLMNYCLLRQMVKQQYEHCSKYPDDVKVIRNLYGDYPQSGYGSEKIVNRIVDRKNKDGFSSTKISDRRITSGGVR